MPNLSIPPQHRVRPALSVWSGRDDWESVNEAVEFVRSLLREHNIRLTNFEVYTKNANRIGLSVYPTPEWHISCTTCNADRFDNELVLMWEPANSGFLVRFYLT